MNAHLPLSFVGRPMRGSGRGKGIGIPTINIDLSDVPSDLTEGIYAGRATFPDGNRHAAAIHYGPRPVHKDSPSFELHLLDVDIKSPPASCNIEVLHYIREIRDFESEAALTRAIKEDVASVRAIIAAHDTDA